MSDKTRVQGARLNERVRLDILNGKWAPGYKLQPTALASIYDTSTTVIREALTRLVGENLVTVEPNRGFFVQTLSLDELRDLTELRCRTETLALELAIERGDIPWESALMAAHYQLSRTPRRGANDPSHVDDNWALAHRAFHAKLIEACRVPVLIDLSKRLSDSTELYRRWAAPSKAASSRDPEREHLEILEATLARDILRASSLLRAHYERTVDVVLESGLVDGLEFTKDPGPKL